MTLSDGEREALSPQGKDVEADYLAFKVHQASRKGRVEDSPTRARELAQVQEQIKELKKFKAPYLRHKRFADAVSFISIIAIMVSSFTVGSSGSNILLILAAGVFGIAYNIKFAMPIHKEWEDAALNIKFPSYFKEYLRLSGDSSNLKSQYLKNVPAILAMTASKKKQESTKDDDAPKAH